jgi:predicted DNA-binding transcriptional regulator YafY
MSVTFDYGNRDGEQTARRVEPYRLVHTSLRWYLLAYDLGRGDWRTFRVDRIAGRPLSGAAFSPRALPGEDVAEWVSQRISSDLYCYRAQVVFHAPASEVSARLSGIAGRIESLSGRRCRVHTGADDLESLAFFLGRLGFDFEVESPDALREFMRAMAGRLARAAGKPDEAHRGADRGRRRR